MTNHLSVRRSWRRVVGMLSAGAFTTAVCAQQIDIGLYPTAVPDSFEVRLVSNGADYAESLVSLVFTLRWESSAGGELNNSDVSFVCSALQFFNIGGVVVDGDHAYATFLILSLHELDENCFISTTGTTLGGIRIRELSGCCHVRIVNDIHTDIANGHYYISVGGYDHTGVILTGPIASDSCAPCTPPQITSISTDTLVTFCDQGQVNLSASASGGGEIHWYGPIYFNWMGTGIMAGYGEEVGLPNGWQGTYTAVAINDCGTDTATVDVTFFDPDCVPPAIMAIDHIWDCVNYQIALNATVHDTGLCVEYLWTIDGQAVSTSPPPIVLPGASDTFGLKVTNSCGSDTMTVVIAEDTGCVPPEIQGIDFDHSYCYVSQFLAEVSALDCEGSTTYDWTGPVDLDDGSATTGTYYAEPGTYQLVVTNSCGTDTATRTLTPQDFPPCLLPVITGLAYAWPDCGPHLALSAYVSDPEICGAFYALWQWPDSSTHPFLGPTDIVYEAAPGLYIYSYTGECGTVVDSILVELLPDCLPPEIVSITHNAPFCAGDTLVLTAEVLNAGPCASYFWFIGSGETSSEPSFTVLNAQVPDVQLHVANGCGSAEMYQVVDIIGANADGPISICSDMDPLDMHGYLPYHLPGGVWMHNGVPHDSLYDPDVDASGVYEYLDPSSANCPAVPVTVVETPSSYNGIGDTITVCSTDEPVDLFTYLGGSPDPGGSWSYGIGNTLTGGMYDPAINYPYAYQYMSGVCSYPVTYMVVGELQPGTPCDDGLAATVNDALDESCTCVGAPLTGIQAPSPPPTGFALWPNPSSGGPWTLLTAEPGTTTGPLIFELVDVLGEVMLTRMLNMDGRTVQATIDPGFRPATGLYLARLQVGQRTFVQRLVIR